MSRSGNAGNALAGNGGFEAANTHPADKPGPRANPCTPTVPWELMFKDWLRSGKSKRAYLIEKMGYVGGGAQRKTVDWARRLIETVQTEGTGDIDLVRTFVAHFGTVYGANLTTDAMFMGTPDLGLAARSLDPNAKSMPKPAKPKAKPTPQTAKPEAVAPGWADTGPDLAQALGTPVAPAAVSETNPSLIVEQPAEPPVPTTGVAQQQQGNKALAVWDQVQDWRANQAVVDWRTAERVRNHITMLTAQHVAEMPALNPDGTPKLDSMGRPKTKLVSTLTPMQVRQLAEATSAVQRTQRLAIGLATDNIGIDIPRSAGDAPNVAGQDMADEAPLFIVEMNQNGKFVRQRPTRVR